ncbi:MotA/TolQ/ExbB proton channel [Desulfovibrio sp. X2]|uniref:MotA/TolQ/ExbB proton channel family protein n=1 Tax=Desulfovibrio sp. X2 TaxID=941449 RepID=UPI00035874E5|nr:MotA/TolQ/ExbB proton channel family protein [Desulfovibrio sp. X2]EPR37040.1 MotA/TolQ/ExbB proton channel [Desulfovibrio sp. X2]
MGEIFLKVMLESGIVIQFVMFLLVAMSIMSWTVVFMKIFGLLRARKECNAEYEAFQQAHDIAGAMKNMDQQTGVYQVGNFALRELRRLEKADLSPSVKGRLAIDNVRRALRQGVSVELDKLGTYLVVLSTCTNIAPFLGLFGTVWGIMRAFNDLGMMKSASLIVVGPGIADALATTVFGLAVAIPSAIFYNMFLGILAGIETTLVNFASAFLNRIQRELAWTAENGE